MENTSTIIKGCAVLNLDMNYTGEKLMYMNAAFEAIMNDNYYGKKIIKVIDTNSMLPHNKVIIMNDSDASMLYGIKGHMEFVSKTYDIYKNEWSKDI